MITKGQLQEIHQRHQEAQKEFKNRCLFVIETLVSSDIIYDDIEKLKGDIYQIAHIGLQTCKNEHEDWKKKMEELFIAFKKAGHF